MLKGFIEKALEFEMEAYLTNLERETGNKRNEKGSKTLKTSVGNIEIDTPQIAIITLNPK